MNSRIRRPLYISLNPDYVAARSLRSLRSNYSEQFLLYSGERALTLISFKNIQLKRNLMPSAFNQPIYPNLPSNVTDIFSTGENKGFHFSFCEGNLKNCKLKVSFLIRRIIIHVSSLLIFEKQTSTLFVHRLLFFSK